MTAQHARIDAAQDARDPSRRLHVRYAAALTVIAFLLLGQQLLVQPAIGRLATDAPVINVAGRQRMLSQKLSKSTLALVAATSDETALARRAELAHTVAEWEKAHRDLQAGNEARELPGLARAAPTIQAAFETVDPHFRAMAGAVRALLDDAPTVATPHDRAVETVAVVLEHEPAFLEGMHEIVGMFEAESREHIADLQATGWTICFAILLTLLALEVLVVRPSAQMIRDQFERQREDYQALVESMHDGLLVHDLQGRVLFANPQFGQMLNVDTVDLVKRPVSTFLPDSEQRRFDALLRQAAEPGAKLKPIELVWRHADGRLIESFVSPRLAPMENSEQLAVLALVSDVTERKRAEERSRVLMAQIEQAAKLKATGVMAAGIAHEMHQPLCAIVNFAEGCLGQLRQPTTTLDQLEEPLTRIRAAAQRAAEITRRMRGHAGQRTDTHTLEDLNALIREVEQLCLPEARRRSVSLELKLAEGLPPCRVDAIQIQQVLSNLIHNACEAMEATPTYRRRISVRTLLLDEQRVQFLVGDSGPGVSPELRETIFEPFFTTRTAGAGLGLAICRTIVESHGGSIEVGRSSDGGALFRCTLPVAGISKEENEMLHQVHEAIHAQR